MKKLSLLLMCFGVSLFINVNAQGQLYRVMNVKFHQGYADEATNIGMDIFNAAYEKAGFETVVLRAESGPSNLMVIIPVDDDDPFSDHMDAVGEYMMKLAGSEEKLAKKIQKYNSMIQSDDRNYFRALTNNKLGNKKHYRTLNIQYKGDQSNKAIDIGMKYFNASANKLGRQNWVLQAVSGDNHLLVIDPVETGSPFFDTYGAEFYASMLEIAGSQDQLNKDMDTYNNAVENEVREYFSLVRNAGKVQDDLQEMDKKEILAAMKAETDAYYQRDYEGWKKKWYQSPACTHAWNNRDGGFTIRRGWEDIHANFARDFNENPEVIHPDFYLDNVDIQLNGDMATVTSDEYVAGPKGKKYTLASGTKILIKDAGTWKLHSVLSYWEYDYNKTKEDVMAIINK